MSWGLRIQDKWPAGTRYYACKSWQVQKEGKQLKVWPALLFSFFVLPFAPPDGCTITRAECVIFQSCAAVHPGKGLDYSTHVSRSLIWILLCSRSKSVEHALSVFYNLPTGHITLAVTLISVDGLSTEVLACLYLENNERYIRWKN